MHTIIHAIEKKKDGIKEEKKQLFIMFGWHGRNVCWQDLFWLKEEKKEKERGHKSVIKQEMEIMTENFYILDPKYQVNVVKQTCWDRVGDNRVL